MAFHGAVFYQLKEDNFLGSPALELAGNLFELLTHSIDKAPILFRFNQKLDISVMIFANVWVLSSTLTQLHHHKLHLVRFGGRVLKENEKSYHPAACEVLVLLQLIKIAHTLLEEKTVHVYTRYSTLEWVFTSKSLYGRAVSFVILLSPYHLKGKRVGERDVEILQLLQASMTPTVGLDETLAHFAPCSSPRAVVCLVPKLLFAQVSS